MKNIILISLIFCQSVLLAQEGIEVSLRTQGELISGTYKKDTENEFIAYVGTWRGIRDNTEYTFKIDKLTKVKRLSPNGYYYYRDLLAVKVKSINLINNAVYDLTPNASIYSEYQITSLAYPAVNGQEFYFMDVEHCRNYSSFYLKTILNNPNQLKFQGFHYDYYIKPDNCPYSDRTQIPLPFPKSALILQKI